MPGPLSSLAWVLLGVLLMAGGLHVGYTSGRAMAQRHLLALLSRANALVLSAAGIAMAALAHSSSAVAVATLAFVEAGLLTTGQGLAVVLGANLGTTTTAQAVSFGGPAAISPITLVAGLAVLTAPRLREPGKLLVGFTAVVEGASALSSGIGQLAGSTVLGLVEATTPRTTSWFFGCGLALTALIQSSTAVSTTAVELAARGFLDPGSALALVLGANVGTVTTGLVASLFLGRRARRLAVLDFAGNIVPALVALAIIEPFGALLRRLDPSPARIVANAHTLFNLCTVAILLPWVRRLGRWADRS